MTDDQATVQLARRLTAAGYLVIDVQTPFPVHGLDEACGLAPTRLPRATFVGGVCGFLLALGFQAWVSVVSWPLDIGGKSLLALPALAPVTFEVTVLLAAFATAGALFYSSRLFPRARPRGQVLPRSTDDRFVILVQEQDAGFERRRFDDMIAAADVDQFIEGWEVV
jgi:hypothetical protein